MQVSLPILSEFNRINLASITPEIIKKLQVFWWFQGEQKLINLLKFVYYRKWNLETIPNQKRR